MPQIIKGLPGKPITSFESQDRLNLPNVQTLGKYDAGYYPELNQEHNRADNQSWLRQVGNGLVSRGLSIVPKLGAGLGSIGGAAVAIFNGDSSTIWDNPINNWFNEMDEGLREMAPVYKSAKYAQGDLLSKMLTTGFWADDAFDGIAYAASAFVPGSLIGKGAALTADALKASDVGRKVVSGLSKVGLNSNRANLIASTAYNTISEASAEAYQTQQEMIALYKEQGLDDKTAKERAATAAAQTFWANTAVLAVPNFVQTSFFHQPWNSVSKEVRKNILENEGKYVTAKAASSVWGKIGTSVVSEGLWEENVQQGIQNYQREVGNNTLKDKDFVSSVGMNMALNVKGFVKSFIPGVTTDALENEGAVAVFLGGLIGTGAAVRSHIIEGKSKQKSIKEYEEKYADLFTGEVGKAALNLFQDSVSSIYKQNGKKRVKEGDKEIEVRDFDMKDGQLQTDPQALINITLGQLRNKQLWDAQMVAAYRNDPLMAEYNTKIALAVMAHDVYTKGYSIEEATKYFDSLKTIGTEEAKTTGVDTFVADNMELAKSYLTKLDKIHTKNASKSTLERDAQNQKFSSFLNKINYYLEVKQDILSAFPSSEVVDKLVLDNASLIEELNTNKEGIKKEYLDTVDDLDNHLKVRSELQDKKDRTPEEQERLDRAIYKSAEFLHVEGKYALVDQATSTLSASLSPYQLSQITPGSRDYFDSAIGRQQLALDDATNALALKEDPAKIADLLYKNVVSSDEQVDSLVEQTTTALQEEQAKLESESSMILDEVEFINNDLLFSDAEPNDSVGEALGMDRFNEFAELLAQFKVDESTPVSQVPVNEIRKAIQDRLLASAKSLGSKLLSVKAAQENLTKIADKAENHTKDESNYRNSPDKIQWLRDNYFKLFIKVPAQALIDRFKSNEDAFDDMEGINLVLESLIRAKAAFSEGPKAEFVKEAIEFIQKVIFPKILDNIKKQGMMQLQSNKNIVKNITTLLSPVKNEKIQEALSIVNSSEPESLDGILIALQSLKDDKEFRDGLEKDLSALLLEYEAFLKDSQIDTTITPGTFRGSSYYAKSPHSYINIILQGAFPTQYNNENSKLYQFRFDQDLDKLVLELKSHSEFSDEQKNQLQRIWSLHNKVISIKYVMDTLDSSVDFGSLLEKKEKVIGDVKPSLQQNIVLNTLLTFLGSKNTGKDMYSNWSLVKGLGGSGKTFVVARILAKLFDKSIYAFSKTTKTSENINKAIFDKDTPSSTFESFMSLTDSQLQAIDVLVLDEVFTFTNMEIESILAKIASTNSKLRVIALGDPSQVTAEESPILTSPLASGLTVTLPLTATYRTNVGPISSVNNRFRLNNAEVSDAYGQANKTSAEALESGISDAVGVMVARDEDEIFKLLAQPSSRSRVLIVNNDEERAAYKGKGYDVETPLTAQGYQWDEVYMLVDKPKLGKSNFEINRGMYTGLSRAKSLIVISPNLGIRESLPNKDLISSTNEASEQIAQAAEFFSTVIEGAKQVKSLLQNGIPSAVHRIILDEEESEASGSEDIASPTSYLAILDEDMYDESGPILPKSDDYEKVHTISHPSNYPLAGEPKISTNQIAHIIRVLKSNGTSSYAIVAQSNQSPNYVLVGMLGADDFGRDDYFATLLDKKPLAQYPGIKLNKTASGFDIPNIEQLSLGEVAIEDYRKFMVMYSNTYDTSDSILDNAIKTFYKDYFGINKSGTRVIPEEAWDGENVDPLKEWVVDGEVNWNLIKNKVSVEIFTLKNPPKDGTKVFYGLPYLVIRDPRQKNGENISKTIYIALDARQLNSSSHYYRQVKQLYDTITLIQAKTEFLVLGEPYLQELVESYVRANFEVVRTGDLLLEKTLAIQKKANTTSLSTLAEVLKLSDADYKELDKLFDELVPLVYGIELKTTYYDTLEEAEALVGSVIEGKKIVAVAESRNKKFYLKYAKDATDESITETFQQYSVRSGQGTAQKALNAIAAANQGVGETNIRIRQSLGVVNGIQKFQLSSHSILSSKDFIDYYRLYNDFPQWGKTAKDFDSVQHLLNWVEKHQDIAGITREELQHLINTKYKTAPYNLNTLSQMLETDENGNSVLREPLRVGNLNPDARDRDKGVNYKGANLHLKENRDYINSKVRTQFTGVRQTYVDIRLPRSEQSIKEEQENTYFLKDLLRPTGTFMDRIYETFFKDSDIKVIKKAIPGLGSNSGAASVWNNVTKKHEIHINYAFNPNDLNAISILLHEAIHSVTANAVYGVEQGTATKKEKEFIEEMTILQKRFNAVIARKGIKRADVYQATLAEQSKKELAATAKRLGKKVSELTEVERLKPTATKINVNEFIANITNPKFQEIASQIEVKPKKSLLSSVIDSLLKLFGLTPESSIYDTMFASIQKLLQTKPTTPATAKSSTKEYQALLKQLDAQFKVDLEESEEYNEEELVYAKYSKIYDANGKVLDEFKKLPVTERVELIKSLLINLDSTDLITSYALVDVPKEGILSSPGALLQSQPLDKLIQTKLGLEPVLHSYTYNIVYTLLHNELFDPYSRVVENYLHYKNDKQLFVQFLFNDILSYQDKLSLKDTVGLSDFKGLEEYLVTNWDSIPLMKFFEQAGEVLQENVNDISFVLNSLQDNSIEAYKEARLYVINEIYKGMTPSSGLVRTKDEVIKSIVDSLNNNSSEGTIRVEKRTLTLLTNKLLELESATPSPLRDIELSGLIDKVNKQRSRVFALQSLMMKNNASGRSMLFYDILADIYPKSTIDDVTELFIYADEEEGHITKDRTDEELEASKGISAHIKEYNKSPELSISDSLKNMVSFIRVGDRFINSSVAYYKILQYLTELDTSQGLERLLIQLHDLNEKNSYSYEDKSIISSLINTIQTALDNTDLNYRTGLLPTHTTIITTLLPSGNVVYYGAHTNTGVDISNFSYEQAVNAEDVEVSVPFGNTQQLYSWINNKDNTINELTFNKMFTQTEAANNVREMFNGFASMKETELYISTRSPRNRNKLALIRSKAAGISFSVKEQITSRLQFIHESYGIERFDEIFKSTFPSAKAKLTSPSLETRIDGIKDFFNFIGLSSITNELSVSESDVNELINAITAGFISATKNAKITDSFADSGQESTGSSFEDFLDNIDGYLTRFSDVISKGSSYVRNPSVRNSKGDKFFKFHESSWAYDTLLNLINLDSSTKKFGGSKGSSKFRRIPDWIDSTFFQDNIYVKGDNKIYAMGEFEGALNTDTNSPTPYARQNKYYFFHNYYLQFFMDGVRQYGDKYFQPVHIPSEKPKHVIVRNNLLSDTGEILSSIESALSQILKRRQAKFDIVYFNESIESDEFRNFSIGKRALEALKVDLTESNLKQVAAKAHEILTEDASKALDEIMPLELTFDIKRNNAILSKLASKVNPKYKIKTKDGDYYSKRRADGKSSYVLVKDDLLPSFDLFFKNNYINSFFLNQLIAGDPAFYKSSADIIKRYAGVFAPGTKGVVDSTMGMKEKFRVLSLKDTLIPIENTKERLQNVIFNRRTPNPLEEAEFNRLLSFFNEKGYEVTDAQGFMSPNRYYDIQKGFGRSWNAKYIMKPVHFELVPITKNGYSSAVPVYLKYSSVVLENSLVDQFPILKSVREKMDKLEVDELIFNSGVKEGLPTATTNFTLQEFSELEDIESLNTMDVSPIMELSNKHFKLQFNPAHDPNAEVAIYTQLMYFLNVFNKTKDQADAAYSIVAEIIKSGREEFLTQIDTPSKFKSFLQSKFKGPGAERALDLLMGGVSTNFPLLEKKSIVALASGMESASIKTKFKGGKLVLQTPEGAAPLIPGTDIRKDLEYKQEEVNGKSLMVAEVILPASMLTAEHLESVRQGKLLYATGDGLAFRIPSTELHSAIVLKIVDTYADSNSNVIIGPKELVPIHGSDFDVDSLFVITRELFNGSDAQLVRPELLTDYLSLIEQTNSMFNSIKERVDVAPLQKELVDLLAEREVDSNTIEKEYLKDNGDRRAYGIKRGLTYNKGRWSVSNKLLYDYTKLVDYLVRESAYPILIPDTDYTPFYNSYDTPIGYTKEGAAYEFNPLFKNDIDDIIAKYELIGQNVPSEVRKLFLPKLNREIQKAKTVKEKFLKNSITEIMLSTISSTDTSSMMRMLSPIFFEKLRSSLNGIPSNLKVTDKYDLSSVTDSYKAYQSLSDGQILTGAFANAVKVFAYLKRSGNEELTKGLSQQKDLKNKIATIKSDPLLLEQSGSLLQELEEQLLNVKINIKLARETKEDPAFTRSEYALHININGTDRVLNHFTEEDINNDNKVTEIFDALINAAIDNLKMGLLPQLKVNTITGSSVVGMVSLGMPIDMVTKILYQPILTKLSSGLINNLTRDWVPSMRNLIEANQDLLENYTLSDKDLDKALSSSFVNIEDIKLTNPELFKIQLAVVDLFMRAHKVGEDMRNMASFMNIIRALPVFIEDIEGVKASFINNIGKIEEDEITFREDFSLIVPNFLTQNPHIKEAYNSLQALTDIIQEKYLVHSPEIEKFVGKYSVAPILRNNEEIDNTTASLVAEKRALVSYILGDLIYNRVAQTKALIHKVPNTNIKYTKSPGRVFSERVATDLELIKKFAESENNAFLQNSYVFTSDSYVKTIRFGGGNGLNSTDIARITLGFNALNKYEVVNGKAQKRNVLNAFEVSPFQEDLLAYAVLNYGMNFSTSNYSNYIKTIMIKGIDDLLNSRLREVTKMTDTALSKVMGPHFYLTHIVQSWERLPFVDDSLKIADERTDPFGNKKYIRNGVDNNTIYYDRKYKNTQAGKPVIHPLFMKVNHNSGGDIYYKVFADNEVSYYQKVGKSSEILFARPNVDFFSLDKYFNPRELTIPIMLEEGDTISSSSNWNIQPGTEFWGVPAYNYDRTQRQRYKLISKSTTDNITKYVVEKVEEVFATPNLDALPDPPEMPTSYALVYNAESMRATGLERDDATSVYKAGNNTYDSVTGKIIPDMQEAPYNPEGTPGDRAADKIWKNKDPLEKVWITDANAEINKEEYKLLIDDKYKKGIAKGNIFHKYIHYYITLDPKVASEIQALMVENNFTEGEFEWITENDNIKRIINKTGTDFFKSNNPLDKIFTEFTIKSDILKSAGTLDMLIDHGDDLYSIHDFKTGASFDRLFEASMFKYASTATEDMWDNPRNRAKLQIMWYALMMKTENPKAKFSHLEIQYIRNRRYIDEVDNRKFINVPAYLEMIENYLKNEKKDIYKKLSEQPHFKSIFDPATYNHVDSKSLNLTGENTDIAMELKLKMLKLQGLVMWDRDLINWKGKSEKSEKVFNEIRDTMDEIIKLQNTTGISYASWDTDMSWMESWVGSASSSTNPYVQLYYSFLQTQKNRAARETSNWESTFDNLLQALRKEADSKDFLGKATRNFVGGDDSSKLFGFAYKKDKNGNLRFLNDKDPEDATEWNKLTTIQKRFLEFVLNTSDKYFIDEASDYTDPRSNTKKALANKVITSREVKGAEKNLTNLDLFNRVGEKNPKSVPFKYQRGFVFKVPPLIEDVRRNSPFLSGKYLKFVWNKFFTNFFEAQFDGWFANNEAIPLKYLGSPEIEDNNNFSLNIEYMMKNVVKQYNYKLHLDEVHSLGTGIKYYLMAKEDESDNIDYTRAKEWFEDSINLHILGRKQTDIELVRRAIKARGSDGKMLQFNFVKFLRSLKQFFAGPTMWLKPVSGLANAVFAGLVTTKEAIRNEFSIYGQHANFKLKDIAFGMTYAMNLYTTKSADGSFRHDPYWLLMEKTRFLPDNYDWFTSSNVLLTGRNKAFTSKTMYAFHSYPEEVLATATFIAQLRSIKLADGSSVFDHYKTVDKIDPAGKTYKEVEWTGPIRGVRNISGVSDRPQYENITELTTEEINNIKFLYEKMHGGYRQDERARAEYYIFGELMFQFKRYMPSILRNLFASKGIRQSQGYFREDGTDASGNPILKWTPQIIEGRFLTLGKLILNYAGMLGGGDSNVIRRFLNLQKDESYDWSKLSDAQKDDMRDFAVTFSMFLALMLGYFNMWDRDEDNSLKRLQLRIANDFAGNSYPLEVLQNVANLGNPVVAKKSVQFASALGELSLSVLFLGMGDEENALTKDGNLRGLNNTIKNTHILSSIYDLNRFTKDLPGDEIDWLK